MRILVTGANGQVGRSMLDLDGQDGHEIIGLNRQQFDLREPEGFDRIVDKIEPDAIVNAAAYTAVDKAEDEPELVQLINAVAPGMMASVAAKNRLPFIHISTDYVFDGTKVEPYDETDTVNPINMYGQTKLAGEVLVRANHSASLILRTSSVFSAYGNNFLKKISSSIDKGRKLRVIDDQFGSPTFAKEIAVNIIGFLEKPLQGIDILNIAGPESITWYSFAEMIAQQKKINHAELSISLERCLAKDYSTRANRPRHSTLSINLLKKLTKYKSYPLNQSIADCIKKYED